MKQNRKKYSLLMMVLLFGGIMSACKKNSETLGENLTETTARFPLSKSAMNEGKDTAVQVLKGYDLPIDDMEKKEAQEDCNRVMKRILSIYEQAEKGETSDVVLSDEILFKMQGKVKKTGNPVTTVVTYSNMENYEDVDRFLKQCGEGDSGSVVVYELHSDGGIGRYKFIFDGEDMYVLTANAIWNIENKPKITSISYTRVKEWEYTDKGWFGYELCVPEPPEVSEIVDGGCMIRVNPMTKEQRELSEKCVEVLGYQGNNLLCSNWDTEHMEKLDYNGIYEYLYEMKYQKKFHGEDYPDGIPKDDFERLLMEYLPITAEKIRKCAVYNEEKETYAWVGLGCGNYAPTFFGTSIPEVTDIRENEDGTVTLTVDAVCDMVTCEEAFITHELIVRFEKDGSFQYLGNEILNDGIRNIPEYQYRIANKCQMTFDENGTIQSIYAFIYGKDEKGEKKTYLIDYDADNSKNMTVWIDGNVNGEYDEDMRLDPMIQILKKAEWKN